MAVISCYGDKQFSEEDLDQNLLALLLKHNVPIMHECGGNGRCTTCRVRIIEGHENVLPRTEKEETIAQARQWDGKTRLACQMRINGDVTIQNLIRYRQDLMFLDTFSSQCCTGTERDLAVMFTDIRDFTTFSEKNLPFDVVHLLNRFFHLAGDAILNNRGYIDKYMGDGILAIFGLEGKDEPHTVCRAAVRAGLGVLEATKHFNKASREEEFDVGFTVGIGIHFGEAIVGEMGHPKKSDFTVLGDTVNVASRIESANKLEQTQLLVSQRIHDLLEGELEVGKKVSTELKGKTGAFQLSEVLGLNEAASAK